jgi:hypothetical protein
VSDGSRSDSGRDRHSFVSRQTQLSHLRKLDTFLLVPHPNDGAGDCGMRQHKANCALRRSSSAGTQCRPNRLELELSKMMPTAEIVFVQQFN